MQKTLFDTDLLKQFREKTHEFLAPYKFSANLCDLGTEIIIEPSTQKHGQNRPDYFFGMQIIYDKQSKTFEISEYQAGKNENELHIYAIEKSILKALQQLVKGNKRKPIKIYK